MKGVETSKNLLRRRVFEEVARLAYEGRPPEDIKDLPYKIIPGEVATYRDSIFLERAIIAERLRTAMGMPLRDITEYSSITDGIEEALVDETYYKPPLVDIIKFACHKCPEKRVYITDACQGCLEHPCIEVCPRKAIHMEKGRAIIDDDKCIKCGLCVNACQFSAIIRQNRPCVASCGVNAIGTDNYGRAKIDHDKCVDCGMCLVNCPFGAIVDKGQIYQTVMAIKSETPVYAIVAPAIAGQFGKQMTDGKIRSAFKALGFEDVIEVALDYLSVGLDPKKVTFFLQSEIPELSDLTFYYMNLVTLSRLERNPTVKQEIKLREFGKSIPVGFMTYPISQAADITAFNANIIPVGEDQLPMIEQTREIVRSFNRLYGETLIEPEAVLPKNKDCLRLPGLDGSSKMSKSLGNCIFLADSKEEVTRKVMSMYTDPNHIRVEDPGKTEGNTVFIYLSAFARDEHFKDYFKGEYNNLDELKMHYEKGGLGDMKIKKFLNYVLEDTLEPIRKKRSEFEKDIASVYKILFAGSDKARLVAKQTLKKVKDAIGLDYRNDKELIEIQQKKYNG